MVMTILLLMMEMVQMLVLAGYFNLTHTGGSRNINVTQQSTLNKTGYKSLVVVLMVLSVSTKTTKAQPLDVP